MYHFFLGQPTTKSWTRYCAPLSSPPCFFSLYFQSHPTAKPVTKTVLSLGNLPPKPTTANELGSTSYPRTPSRVDPNNPPWPAYRGKILVLSHSRVLSTNVAW